MNATIDAPKVESPKPARTLRVVNKCPAERAATVEIKTRDKAATYLVQSVVPGNVMWTECDADAAERYYVCGAHCTCKGFHYRGECKHQAATAKLVALGVL